MNEEQRRTYTIRLPEQVAEQIEKRATALGIAPTTLLQSLITRHSAAGSGGSDTTLVAAPGEKIEAIRKACELLQRTAAERYGQLLFEVVKTRSALFHSLDQNLAAPVVDEIIEASEKTARQYIARLSGAGGNRQ
jgi:hypothetical protein